MNKVDRVYGVKDVMRKAVLISGRGSNLKALLDGRPEDEFFVFSDKKKTDKKSPGLAWAQRRGVLTQTLDFSKEHAWENFAKELNRLHVKEIYLLGFMKIVPSLFLDRVRAQVYNIHPSYLPKFPGLKSLERSFDAKDGMGCTLHKVSPKVDQGEIVFQKKILCGTSDLKEFAHQVHQFEQYLVSLHTRRVG